MPSARKSNSPRRPRLEWERRPAPPAAPASLGPAEIVRPEGRADSSVGLSTLYEGDNLALMRALLPEFAGRINLIYADPPFLSGKSYPSRIGRGEDSRRPSHWLLGDGYADDWPDPATYLDMLEPRLRLIHELLSPRGTLYLHLDWHAAHYARLLLDDLFGPERLLNEIAWVYHGPSPVRRAFNRKHDTILAFTKSDDFVFNHADVRVPYDISTRKTFASSKAGFGKVPDLDRGKVPEDWWYFPVVARLHAERTGYPTQKPEALLERIVRASSDPGDWVADFFCGSGTLPVVAERLGRRWLAADASPRAVHTTKKRLIASRAAPFAVGSASPMTASLTAVCERLDGLARVTLTGFVAAGGERFPDDVDFWEVGVIDGGVFQGLAHGLRPQRHGALPTRLHCPVRSGAPIVVRAVSIFGERGELCLDP